MSCEKTQERIVAQLRASAEIGNKESVHLKRCSRCREFVSYARQAALDKLAMPPASKAPSWLWPFLKDRIQAERQAVWLSGLENILLRIKICLYPTQQLPLAIKAVFTVCSIIIVGQFVIPASKKQSLRYATHTQYLMHIMGYSQNDANGNDSDYGVSLSYFTDKDES